MAEAKDDRENGKTVHLEVDQDLWRCPHIAAGHSEKGPFSVQKRPLFGDVIPHAGI
jgi:hypothetical protein